MVLGNFAFGVCYLFYGSIERLLDPYSICARSLRLGFNLHLPYHCQACKSDEIGN